MENNIKRVHTGKDLAISSMILVLGIGLYFVNAGLGIVIAVCGCLMLLFVKSGAKMNGEGALLTKVALDIDHSCRDSVKDYLDGKDVDPKVEAPAKGGVVRLEAYFNRQEDIVYAQLFDFSNYTYEKATELVGISGVRARKLISKL
ncbi:MAG: hypothetical protein IJV54_03185 [Bacteroidales bacterium]|nr:hypothetical protein [Bacteroidales bacterium]MBQ9711271.1 hypothetical protein [Bacteroidales bacterium]